MLLLKASVLPAYNLIQQALHRHYDAEAIKFPIHLKITGVAAGSPG